MKALGVNAIRTSHNPPAPEFLDLCDRMGFLVMAEPFDEWRQPKAQTPVYGYHRYFDEWAVRDLTDMILRDRNHPSIVLWSAGNEVPDGGPAEVSSALGSFFKLNDFGVGARSTGWQRPASRARSWSCRGTGYAACRCSSAADSISGATASCRRRWERSEVPGAAI
jgi:hypothetical protein